MAQDLRDLLKVEKIDKSVAMSKGHEDRFLKKLERKLPLQKPKNVFNFLSIAASIVIFIGFSFGIFKYYQSPDKTTEPKTVANTNIKTLGDLSPNLKKVEDYYLASINLELSKIQITPQNKELFDGYVDRLQELNEEYDRLTIELNNNGPMEETIDALIDNLKFRLSLLNRLKVKLAEFHQSTFSEENI